MRSIEPGISRFRVWCYAPSRNDSAGFFVASLVPMPKSFAQNHLFDLAQLLLAEKHYLADKECRRAECGALARGLGLLDQLCRGPGLLSTPEQPCRIEAGPGHSPHRRLRVVHF